MSRHKNCNPGEKNLPSLAVDLFYARCKIIWSFKIKRDIIVYMNRDCPNLRVPNPKTDAASYNRSRR
jgi:hypothetical protein